MIAKLNEDGTVPKATFLIRHRLANLRVTETEQADCLDVCLKLICCWLQATHTLS